MTLRIALNATAYDDRPSGARRRAVGLAAGLLERGATVQVFSPPGLGLAAAVEDELGEPPRPGRLIEVPTPLRPDRPKERALRSRRFFERRVPEGTDLFVTDYYPALRSVPTAITVHDLRYLVAPQWESAARVAWFWAFYPRLARRAARVAVPTTAVARDVREHLEVPEERIAVVPNGLSRHFRQAPREPLAPEHFLLVGAAEPRKDLATAIAALREALRAGPLPPLRVVGRDGAGRRAALGAAADLLETGAVELLGDVGDAELVRLVRSSTAVLHPSRYEGFGLPVVEALAVGVPVIAACCAAVAEVAGGAAELLEPGDVAAWAAAIRRAAAHPRAAQDPAALERARGFSWPRAAAALLECVPR